ncbi:MAG: tetratricopeptide repeat protein [Polyangiaceae bacterium]
MTLRPLLLLASLASVGSFANAPIQCGHETDPALRKDETPGDALWDLAEKFHEAHDEAASERTLAYLVDRYPASRWAPAARERLGTAGGGADGGK